LILLKIKVTKGSQELQQSLGNKGGKKSKKEDTTGNWVFAEC
jgi:hypothetical protein